MAKKKKGPLRLEAIIPTIIIFVGIGAYFHFFFDLNLKWGAEWIGTRVHGAEVNIGKIRSSVFGGNLRIQRIQVTNKDEPSKNLIEIGNINMELLWDGLLRGKIVVNEASVNDIKIGSPRKRPGRVIPPDDKSSSAMRQAEKAILDQGEKKFNKNILGDIAGILGGVDPSAQLKKIEGDLKSEKKIQQLDNELKTKQIEWDKMVANLPDQKVVNNLQTEFNKLKFNSKNTVQFLKDLDTANKLIKQADKEINKVSTAANQINKDIQHFSNEISQLDSIVKQDVNDLQKRLKIPDLSMGDVSNDIFGGYIAKKIAPYNKYINMALEYMPPDAQRSIKDIQAGKIPKGSGKKKQAKQEAAAVPQKSFSGKTFKYPITVSYPSFWLKRAAINSKSTEGGFSGDLSGEILDVTSNQAHIGRPTVANFKGDFPTQNVMGLDAKATLDHRTIRPVDKVKGVVKAYSVGKIELAQGSNLSFAIANATAKTQFSGQLMDGKLGAIINTQLNEVKYDIDSSNKDVKNIFTATVKDIPTVTLNAKVTGSFSDLNFNINSNLGRALQQGISSQINKRIAAARKKIEAMVTGRIDTEKSKLTNQFNQAKSGVDQQVNKVKGDLTAAKTKVQNDISQKQKKAQDQQKNKVINDLRKKLKF